MTHREALAEEADVEQHLSDIPPITDPKGRTEAANAQRLVASFGRNFRFVAKWNKYITWNSKKGCWDSDSLRMDAMAKKVAAKLWADIGKAGGKPDSEVLAFCKASSSAHGIASMVQLARSEPGVAISPDDLNQHPFLFNCANGTLDLRSGEFREHRREDLLTQTCRVQYDPQARCPFWHGFIETICKSDRDLMRYIQQAAGMCLTGDVSEHVLLVCYGRGGNGKSTLLNALQMVFGPDYAMHADQDLLVEDKHGNRHPTGVADLFGKRFVACVEVEGKFNEKLVKQLTGGDKLRARRMREDFWEFPPSHKLWLATNDRPEIGADSDGMWRRVKLIPFLQKFATGPQECLNGALSADTHFGDKLAAEASGILNWLIVGCQSWMAAGQLVTPSAVVEATEGYRKDQDDIGQFIADKCVLESEARVRSSAFVEAYQMWCKQNSLPPKSGKLIGSYLKKMEIEKLKSNGVWYLGIGLRADEHADVEPESSDYANCDW